jgi:hypothetical protein
MYRILISGRTVGGSSYTDRIIKAVLDNPNETVFEVFVLSGNHQDAVIKRINKTLYNFTNIVYKFNGHINIKISIIKDL